MIYTVDNISDFSGASGGVVDAICLCGSRPAAEGGWREEAVSLSADEIQRAGQVDLR